VADAIVHEWISGRRGSERVFEAIAACRPDAHLHALSAAPGHGLDLGGRQLTTTFLDRRVLRERRGATLPLMSLAWRAAAGPHRYDTVVVSHHAAASQFARFCRADRRIAYVHTPARYVWTPELDRRGASSALTPMRALLKRADRRSADRLDAIAANSAEVAGRIERFWGRSAVVIHPPVDTVFFTPSPTAERPSRDFLLGMSRFVPYKRLDLVIEVGERIGMPVVLAGSGPDEARLRALAARATVPVEIVLTPSDEELRHLYRNAACLVFPAHEDFGIVPVEAQACGTPVVGVAAGGCLETIRHGVSGILVDGVDTGSFADAVVSAGRLRAHACVQWAERFSLARFQSEIRPWLDGTTS